MKKALCLALLFFPEILLAYPRIKNPSTPNEVQINFNDVSDEIGNVQTTLLSTFTAQTTVLTTLITQASTVPIGAIMDFAGATAPSGWLLCNGAAVSRTTYSGLFGIIGTTYGAGNGSTTFNVPDTRGRTSIGTGQGSGLTDRVLATAYGSETHDHTQSAHSHSVDGHTHTLASDNASHYHQIPLFENTAGDRIGITPPTDSPYGYESISQAAYLVGALSGYGTYNMNYVAKSNVNTAAHSHSGATGSTGSATNSQTPAIANTNNVPPSITFNKIIKF